LSGSDADGNQSLRTDSRLVILAGTAAPHSRPPARCRRTSRTAHPQPCGVVERPVNHHLSLFGVIWPARTGKFRPSSQQSTHDALRKSWLINNRKAIYQVGNALPQIFTIVFR
jgi:hypothetical protein